MMDNMRVGIFAGGPSSEREISLRSGEAIFNALKASGIESVLIDIKGSENIKEVVKENNIKAVFLALHGKFGEDGTIQRILEEIKLPYTGSGPEASRLALDKIATHNVFLKNQIPMPPFKSLNKLNPEEFLDIDFPVVVKPQFEGSSIGLSIVDNALDYKNAKTLAFKYGDNIIVEKYIEGRELTVGILNDSPLPVVEIKPKTRFYDFKAKYSRTDTEYIVPAKLSPGESKLAQHYGLLAHKALGCRQISRVDIMLGNSDNKFYVLEVNTIPGFTSRSLFPKAAAASGINFNELCLNILTNSIGSLKEKKGIYA